MPVILFGTVALNCIFASSFSRFAFNTAMALLASNFSTFIWIRLSFLTKVSITLFGTIFFMIPIISWICDTTAMNYIGMYGFIAGSLEVLAAMYYLYNLIIKNSL